MIFEVFFLLILFQLKHFVVDYLLQGKYMLQKFRPDWGFFFPLLAHAGLHAITTLAIVLWAAPYLWWLALVDLAIHFIMDRVKAGPKYLGRYKALSGKEIQNFMSYKETIGIKRFSKELNGNTYFWWSLGLDQMIHHLTQYYIIFMLIMDKVLC